MVHRLVTGCVAMLGMACAVGFVAAPAGATGAAQIFTFQAPGGFGNASGAAVDQSNGDVYVSDLGDGHVWKFKVNLTGKSAEPELAFSGGPGKEGFIEVPGTPFQPAVDNYPGADAGDLFVSEISGNAVTEFSPTGAKLPSSIEGLAEPTGVGLDMNGNIYVSELGGSVLKFNAAGKPVNAIGIESPDNTLANANSGVRAMAVDSSGEHIYLASENGVIQYNLSGDEYKKGVTFSEGSGTDGVAIIPAGSPGEGDVLVESPGVIHDYSPSEPSAPIVSFNEGLGGGGAVARLAAYGTATGAVVFAPNEGSGVDVFETFKAPTLTTGAATEATQISAKVTGTVNPEGLTVSACFFEYEANGEKNQTPCEGALPTGNTSAPVSAKLTGLTPNTNYSYNLVVEGEGHLSHGNGSNFTTLPVATATTEAPSSIGAEAATLDAKVDLLTGTARYYFEYGQGEPYAKTEEKALALGEQTVTDDVTGLEPNKLYHVRIVIVPESPFLPVEGGLVEFTTKVGEPVVSNESSAHEGRHGAALSGEVNPEDGETTYYIEYAKAQAYAEHGTYDLTSPSAPILNGEGHPAPLGRTPVPIGPVVLSELKAGTVYDYRLVAKNIGGTTYGSNATFATTAPTPPVVESESASQVTQTSATLTTTVNPDGLPTTYALEVGTEVEENGVRKISYTPTYGNVNENEPQSFSLTGLLPATTYHYRIVATNEDGTVPGPDQTFTTPGFPPIILAPPSLQLVPVPKEEQKVVKVETRAQKYVKAVELCEKDKSKKKRTACLKTAKQKYGPVTKKKKK